MAGVVELDLGDGGWAVKRLLGRVVEGSSVIADMLAGDDAQWAGGDTVFEVASESGGEVAATAALDAVGHPEPDVEMRRRVQRSL